MEKDKILKILEKVSLGTKLYSPTFGEVKFNGIRDCFANEQRIAVLTENKINMAFLTDGKFRKSGEVMLFPSKEMRDWDKFAWKKGDVLVNKDRDAHIVFEKFTDNTYTTFTGRHYYMNDGKNKDAARACCNVSTECYTLETEDVAQSYINDLEKRLGGKLNHNTLEIEKHKPEHKFEPFEKVLVRDQKTDKWTVDLYGFEEKEDGYNYQCVGGCCVYCIQYKGNEHLLGTTNDPD